MRVQSSMLWSIVSAATTATPYSSFLSVSTLASFIPMAHPDVASNPASFIDLLADSCGAPVAEISMLLALYSWNCVLCLFAGRVGALLIGGQQQRSVGKDCELYGRTAQSMR